jgi:uncharacterized RDD family membrane protein YckC
MKTIEITTTQNVTIEYELAAVRERALAWLIDVFVVAFGYLLVFQLFSLVDWTNDSGWMRLVVILPFLVYFLYNAGLEIWNNGQTIGKKFLNIKVVRLDGKDPEWSDLLLRSVLHLVDSIFSGGLIGIVLIKTTPHGQRLGDMAAHTSVIKIFNGSYQYRLEAILNISSLANYEPKFPQARNLSEQDVIVIKRVLDRQRRYPNKANTDAIEDLVTRLMPLLEVTLRPYDRQAFLRTVMMDYIVLTR